MFIIQYYIPVYKVNLFLHQLFTLNYEEDKRIIMNLRIIEEKTLLYIFELLQRTIYFTFVANFKIIYIVHNVNDNK